MSKIKSICLGFPNADDGSVLFYNVGRPWKCNREGKVVTEIKAVSICPEPYCEKVHYEIYTEDGLVAEMHQYGHIVYEDILPTKPKEE
jgi:hypothetical protein